MSSSSTYAEQHRSTGSSAHTGDETHGDGADGGARGGARAEAASGHMQGNHGDERAAHTPRTPRDGNATSGSRRATRADSRECEEEDDVSVETGGSVATRAKRTRGQYDVRYFPAQRAPRKRRCVYLATDGRRQGRKRDAIEAGVATLERTVANRYDWRDAGTGPARKRNGRALFQDGQKW